MAESQPRASQMYTDAEKTRRRSEPVNPAPEHAASAESTQIVESSAVERHAAALGDSRLDHSANAVRRAGIAEYVQQTYGNEHMHRVIRQVRAQRVSGKGAALGRVPLRPNPFGPGVEQEAGAQTPATREGGFAPEAAARIRHEIMTPVEQTAEDALGASPPDTVRAMRLISQAIYATAHAPRSNDPSRRGRGIARVRGIGRASDSASRSCYCGYEFAPA